VSLQVQNLFDRDPPFLFSGSNGTGFDAAVANAFGRQAIISVRKAW
jgi:outer membrane receptor protein involved in Fe transport